MIEIFSTRTLKQYLEWHVLVILFIVLVSLFLSYLALTFPFALIIFCLTLIGASFIYREKLNEYSVKIRIPKSLHIMVIWAICLLLPLVTPSYSPTALNWFQINPLAIIAAVAGIVHLTFFVGFGVLHVFSIGARLRPLEQGLFSTILSLLLTGGIAFVTSIIGLFSRFAIPAILVISLSLLLFYAYKCIRTSGQRPQMVFTLGYLSYTIPMILLVVAGFCLVNYPFNLVPTIDQWFHFGSALDTQNNMIFDAYPSYYWNSLFDAMILSISPLPPANTYLLLLPLGLLVIPAFYVLVRSICRGDETDFSTVIYTLFSGLGGILAVLHQIMFDRSPFLSAIAAASQTGDGLNGSLSFPLFYVPKSIGLAAVFLCLFVMIRQDNNDDRFSKFFLLSLTFALAYLWHIAEAMFLILILPFLMVFIIRDDGRRVLIAVSMILAFGLVFIIDSIAPYAVYYFSIGRTTSVLVSGLLLGTLILIVSIAILGQKFKTKDVLSAKLTDYAMKSVISVIILVSTLELVVWLFSLPHINFVLYEGVVPLFLYPAKLGLPLLFALVVISRKKYLNKHKGVQVSALITLLALLIGRASSLLFLAYTITVFWETRVIDFLWPFLSILAGVSLAAISRRISRSNILGRTILKKQIWVVGLLIILFIGFSSKPYEIEVRSQPSWYITIEDVKALDILKERIEGYSVVGGDIHLNSVRDFTPARTLDIYSNYLLEAKGMVETASIMRYYTYSKSESAYPRFFISIDRYAYTLDRYSKSYLINHLLGYLPLISNTTTDVYQIPFLNPPSRFPSILVCLPRYGNSESIELLFDMLAMSNVSYSFTYSDSIPLTSNVTTILSLDPLIETKLLSWVQGGGNLIHVNCSVVDYSSQSVIHYDRIGSHTNQLFVRGLLSPTSYDTNGTNVLHWYLDGDSQVYPLFTSSRRGVGAVANLNLWPIFSTISSLKHEDNGRFLWRTLPEIWSFLEISEKADANLECLGIAVARESIQMNGTVNVSSTTLLFDGQCIIEYLNENNHANWSAHMENMTTLGNVHFNILSSNIKLGLSNLTGTTALTSTENLTLTLSLQNDEKTILGLRDDVGTYSVVLEGGNHTLKFIQSNSSYSLKVESPIITCDGSLLCNYLYAAQPFDVYIKGIAIAVYGFTQFRILAAQSIICITDLVLDGQLLTQNNGIKEKIGEVYSKACNNLLFLPCTFLAIITAAIFINREVFNNEAMLIFRKILRRFSNSQPKCQKAS